MHCIKVFFSCQDCYAVYSFQVSHSFTVALSLCRRVGTVFVLVTSSTISTSLLNSMQQLSVSLSDFCVLVDLGPRSRNFFGRS